MTYTAPDHYSYKFKFDIEKLPASQKDRIPCRLAIWGILFGLFFIALGLFDAIAYFFEPADTNYNFNLPDQSNTANIGTLRYVFDSFVLVFGILITCLSTMAAAMEEGLIHDDDVFVCNGSKTFGDVHVHCWNLSGHGAQTAAEILKNSCNVGFMELGARLGAEKLNEYIKKLGFGSITGLSR